MLFILWVNMCLYVCLLSAHFLALGEYGRRICVDASVWVVVGCFWFRLVTYLPLSLCVLGFLFCIPICFQHGRNVIANHWAKWRDHFRMQTNTTLALTRTDGVCSYSYHQPLHITQWLPYKWILFLRMKKTRDEKRGRGGGENSRLLNAKMKLIKK